MTNYKSLLKESETRIKKYQDSITESEKSFRELNASNMQGTLIQIEDFLDTNHLYVFENWIDGVIYDGPNIERYWVDVTLKYPYSGMPDPAGALRLHNIGAIINYEESKEYVAVDVKGPEDLDPLTRKPKEEERRLWLINIKIPRKFIEDAIENNDDENIQNKWKEENKSDEQEEKNNNESDDLGDEL